MVWMLLSFGCDRNAGDVGVGLASAIAPVLKCPELVKLNVQRGAGQQRQVLVRPKLAGTSAREGDSVGFDLVDVNAVKGQQRDGKNTIGRDTRTRRGVR